MVSTCTSRGGPTVRLSTRNERLSRCLTAPPAGSLTERRTSAVPSGAACALPDTCNGSMVLSSFFMTSGRTPPGGVQARALGALLGGLLPEELPEQLVRRVAFVDRAHLIRGQVGRTAPARHRLDQGLRKVGTGMDGPELCLR